MSRMFSYFGLDREGGKKKKRLNPPQMGISLKTDMQMLGLSNTKMFSFFLRIMAYCLLSLGDLTSEGGSLGSRGSRVWERAGGRGTRQISGGAEDSRPAPWASGRPSPAPQAGEVGGCLPGTGGGDTGKARCPTLLRMCTDISPVLPCWGRG